MGDEIFTDRLSLSIFFTTPVSCVLELALVPIWPDAPWLVDDWLDGLVVADDWSDGLVVDDDDWLDGLADEGDWLDGLVEEGDWLDGLMDEGDWLDELCAAAIETPTNPAAATPIRNVLIS